MNTIYHALSEDHCLRKTTKVLQQEWKNMAKLKKGTPPQKKVPGMDLDRLPSVALLPLLWSSQWSMYGYSVSPWHWCFSTRISCLGAGKRLETFKNIEVIGKLTEFCLRKGGGVIWPTSSLRNSSWVDSWMTSATLAKSSSLLSFSIAT